jgi:very-short-patch-repair endonuclease
MRHPIIPYDSNLKERARELRKNMTLAEILLWKQLKGKQLCGYDFDRQRPLGGRIVDFYCKDLMLAVDVDGSVHDFTREKDEARHREIEALGVTLLRFWNYDVKNDIRSVLKRIEVWIRGEEQRRGWPRREAKPKPTPNPSTGGEQRAAVPRHGNQPSPTGRAPSSSPPGRGQGWVSGTPETNAI